MACPEENNIPHFKHANKNIIITILNHHPGCKPHHNEGTHRQHFQLVCYLLALNLLVRSYTTSKSPLIVRLRLFQSPEGPPISSGYQPYVHKDYNQLYRKENGLKRNEVVCA